MAVATPSRSRPGGGRLFIFAGAALALVAFILVFLIGRTGTGSPGGGGPTTKVVVAAHDIALRTQLGASDLQVQDYPSGGLATTFKWYTKSDEITKGGLIAEINIAKGQLITQNMLAQQGDLITGATPAYLPIPAGYVAVTIPAGGEVNGVAGFIQAGDYISMIATVQLAQFATTPPPPGAPTSATKTIFQNLHVLRLGPAVSTVQPAGGSSGSSAASQGTTGGLTSSMTVIVTACDAEYLTWIVANSTIKYELESFHDYQPADTTKPDASCPSVLVTRGVTSKQVDSRYHFTSI